MIDFITAEQTLPLRSLVLRDGLEPSLCSFPQDAESETFHLGYFSDSGQLVCVLSCQKEKHGKLPKAAFRLRGMATHPNFTRRGYAKQLIVAAEKHLSENLGIPYLWFNARVQAFPFYEAMGFEFMSDEFDIPGIGPHREMFKLL